MKTITIILFWLSITTTHTTVAAVGGGGLEHSNFTALDSTGHVFGGTNDVAATWNGETTTNIADTDFDNMTIASDTTFSGFLWEVHHIRVFGAGNYTFDTSCSIEELEEGNITCNNGSFISMTVKPGQIGVHMLFDWNSTTNIDVLNVYDIDTSFATSPPGGLFTGGGYGPYPWSAPPDPNKKWRLASTDIDGDGIAGIPLADGPKGNFSFNFNLDIAQGDNNYSLLDQRGNIVGGSNDVVAWWNGSTTDNIADTNFDNMTISTNWPFKGHQVQFHHIRVFSEGVYTFDSSCTTTELEAGTTVCAGGPFLNMTVGANQIGTHMLLNFLGSIDWDVVNVYDINSIFASGIPDNLWLGSAFGPYTWSGPPALDTIWRMASIDADLDGIPGISMVDGPFADFSINFNLFRTLPDKIISGEAPGTGSGNLSFLDSFLLIPFALRIFRKKANKKQA